METTQATTPNLDDLSVWWIPQIPGEAFRVPVSSIEEGRRICDLLAEYDSFQYEQNVKSDYCNEGGIIRWESDGGGSYDWFDAQDENGDDAWPVPYSEED